jgi:hypothetical protein
MKYFADALARKTIFGKFVDAVGAKLQSLSLKFIAVEFDAREHRVP